MSTKKDIYKKKDKEVVYEQLGYDVGEADEHMYMERKKQGERDEVIAQQQAEAESGLKIKWETSNRDENGNRIELPARLAFEDSKVNMGRLPVWYLNAMGSMSESELEDFMVKYGSEMSLNERLSASLLMGANRGRKEDVDRFWNIQMKMIGKTNVNMNVNVNNKPDSVVSNLLDNIAKNIQEANVVQEFDKDTPTPQNL